MRATKGSSSTRTPTLLHFVVRQLLKTDASLVRFLDEGTRVEAASRGGSAWKTGRARQADPRRSLRTVSVASVAGSVSSVASGLAQVKAEIKVVAAKARLQHAGDRFLTVMGVRVAFGLSFGGSRLMRREQPFAERVTPVVEGLLEMHKRLEANLRSLLVYYGKDTTAARPEEFFGVVASFASSLEVSCFVLEIHDVLAVL
jgi:diaphanous 1